MRGNAEDVTLMTSKKLSLQAQAWQNELQGWLELSKSKAARDVFKLEEKDGLSCFWFCGESGMENILLATSTDPSLLTSNLKAVRSSIDKSLVATSLRFPESKQLADAAGKFGFSTYSKTPIMQRKLRNTEDAETRFDVHRVTTYADYHAALNLVREVYDDPPKLTRFFYNPEVVSVYVAYYQNRVAAAATLWSFADIAGIYSVATHPEFRGKGLAGAVIRFIIGDAEKQGFEHTCLRTTNELIPFYNRLKFKVISYQSQWLYFS